MDGAIIISAGKYARNMVLTAVQQLGGQDFVTQWARENPTEFMTKLFAKTITREIDDKKVDTVESLLDAIDAECEEVQPEAQDAEFEDV